MEFALDDDQQALQSTARQFLADQAPSAYVREMTEDDAGCHDEFWEQLVDLGWVGLLVPEAQGGSGMGLLEMMVVLEEMGRLPLPGPFLSSAVLATLAARGLGLDDRLASLATGATRGTVAIDEDGHGDVSTGSAPGPAASPDRGGSPGPSRSSSTATPPTGCWSRRVPRRDWERSSSNGPAASCTRRST